VAKSIQVPQATNPDIAPDTSRALIARDTGACVKQEGPQYTGRSVPESLSDYLFNCERSYIDKVLCAKGGRIGDTAAALGISRKRLWGKMKRLNLHVGRLHAGTDIK
jgi:DNA-binding NtrC family response regulator